MNTNRSTHMRFSSSLIAVALLALLVVLPLVETIYVSNKECHCAESISPGEYCPVRKFVQKTRLLRTMSWHIMLISSIIFTITVISRTLELFELSNINLVALKIRMDN